ncbi:MAG: zinc-dependent alcohol dehydrogenase family protein [Actinomycetes bacterium]
MKAIYFESFGGELSLAELPIPKAEGKSVVIQVMATGLCRSDWHAWVGHDSDIRLPHVPGHEFAGVISEVGAEVKNFHLGDRVTVPFVCGCGECEFCLSGNAQVCPTQSQPGFTNFGSFAEYVEIENADFNLVSLPVNLSFESAASLGCRFATAFRGLTARAKVQPGEVVAIFGCGGVGLSAVMIAKALGAIVIAIDISETALAKAQELGADFVINSAQVSVADRISELTSGGADVAVDAFGSQTTASAAILSLRRRGRHLQLGLLPSESGKTELPMARAIAFELDLLGSHGMAAVDYPALLKLVSAGLLQPQLLVDSIISLSAGVAALSTFEAKRSPGMTIIKP